MTNKILAIASIFEALTGVLLIIAPGMVRFLLVTDISSAAAGITRAAGIGLLVLGIACWPRVEGNTARVRAMLIYNSLAAVYLAWLRLGTASAGNLLLAAVAIHAVLAILFAGVWLKHEIT